jgi:hypothetical protein
MVLKDAIDYVGTGCDPRLSRDRTATLGASLPASQTDGLIVTTTPPTGWPTEDNQRDVAIDAEIIEYTSLKTSGPPYGFVGPFVRAKNQGGPNGLQPQNHSAGASIGHLVMTIDGVGYRWGIASGGVDQWCADIASTVNAAGFQFAYLDGVEEVEDPKWYTVSLVNSTFCQLVQNNLLYAEGVANSGCFSWPLVSIDGQIDYYRYRLSGKSIKSEVDFNAHYMETSLPQTAYIPRQLGWAQIAQPGRPPTTPDEVEYILAKSAAYDASIVYQMWVSTLNTWPNRDANMYLMSKFEELRLAGYFPPAVKEAAKRPGRDFMLFTDDGGNYQLAPTVLLSIANSSSVVRGFITMEPVSGSRYVTLWTASGRTDVTLIISGVTPADLQVKDYRGNPVQVTSLPGEQVAFPVSTRMYIKLANVPDPTTVFGNATVRIGNP